jgi:transposase
VLTDGNGVPIAVALDGANRHDRKMTEAPLEAQRIVPSDSEIRNLCLDKGYDDEEVRELIKAWGFVGHIPARDERKRVIHDIANYRARRWVVERTHSWMNRFRRLLIRWQKKPQNDLAMIHLAFACIAVRAIQVFG